ncbi:hypothetical protein AVV41_gp142 [Microcystis phage MaMV-DC]|uniref:Uncharacterized protein n=1 Tax=Microcystis phage MaMV-DC TaxID=1357715 RepID=A0A075BS73_9CAUD|nr:hypothetical protein AVV41_gp142 [Microcystis phage MaMV-DC]AGR48707.1 hypothetical protein MaMVDC_142 [Microcystis phage MaMV-DC]
MKIVDSSKWAPRNKFNIPLPMRYYYDSTGLESYIPELNIDWFYYKLVSALYILYKNNVLDKDGYFYEDN